MHISTYIFPARVADGFVGGRVFARTKIKANFISVQTAFMGDVVRDDLADRHLICMSRMEGAHTPAALDQDDDETLVRWTRLAAFRAWNNAESWVTLLTSLDRDLEPGPLH